MKNMKAILGVGLVLLIGYSRALIVPQELPSILSLVYSNIPPVKKGTDSRLGFGFRLGDHADFQLMFELGPQKETRPIGSDAGSSGTSKRNVDQNDYPRNLVPKTQNVVPQTQNKEASSWLTTWSKDMRKAATKTKPTYPSQLSSSSGGASMVVAEEPHYIQTVPLIPESSLKQLQALYRQDPITTTTETSNAARGFSKPASTLQDQFMIVIPNEESTATPPPNTTLKPTKSKAQITADLMDVELN